MGCARPTRAQRIFRRGQACLQRIVAVDYRGVHIVQRARQLRRLNLNNFDLLRVLADIFRRHQRRTGFTLRIETDQPFILQ